MWQPDPSSLATHLSDHFGLSLTGLGGRDSQGHPWIEIQPTDLHRHDGFRVLVELGWRNLRATFIPGAFAGDLVGDMANAPPQSKALFVALAQRAIDEGAVITMNVNGSSVSPTAPITAPLILPVPPRTIITM